MDPIKDDAQFQGTLTPEQKAFFETYLPTVKESAVSEFKTKAEEERKKAIPEKYELKLPDGSPLDPKEDVDKIAARAREQGLSAADAQKFAESIHEHATAVVGRLEQTFQNTLKTWETETWSDKELGGEKKAETEQNIKRVVDKFGSAELKELFTTTGFGNQIHFVRFVNAIGKAMKEDG